MALKPWPILLSGPRTRRPLDVVATAAFVVGGGLLVWSAYIHFHLWHETGGYRSIPTIGPLFLMQSIVALALGIGVVVVRRLWAALVGLAFAAATIAGFLLSVARGLFGFKDSWLAPFAKQAFWVELVAVAVFAVAGALCLVGSDARSPSPAPRAGVAA
jgi:hypothetical protein